MKKMFKAAAAACGMLALLTLPGCGSQGGAGQKVYFVAHADATGFTGLLYEGVKSRMQGAEVEFLNANGDPNLQIDQLKAAIEEKPAAIVLLAVDGNAVIPAVEKANEAGIPVIATNRDLNGGTFANVASDEAQAGRLQGEYMAKHLPQGAKVVYLMGESRQSGAIARWEGFKAACLDKRPDIQLLAKADANWSEAEGLKDMTLWLQIYPQIDAVVCGNDNMALGALHALKAAGKSGVLISGVDAVDDALKAVAAGDMSQTVKQDAEGQGEGAFALIQAVRQGNKQPEDILVPFVEITKANIGQFLH